MAKIKNNFIRGGVNKSADERLLPNGSVRDIRNAITNVSEGDDSGTIENVLANTVLTENEIDGEVIHSVSNDAKGLIYYFIKGNGNSDYILEYDSNTGETDQVLRTFKNGALNFNKRITHSNIIQKSSESGNAEDDSDLLAWCGDDNPPRIINIERCKTYGFNAGDISNDIDVIKPAPKYAPEIEPLTLSDTGRSIEDQFLIFAYRYRYKDGYYSAISSSSEYLFSPSSFRINFDTFENEGMSNIYNACDIKFDTGNAIVDKVELLFKRSNSQNWSIIDSFDKEKEGWDNDEIQTFRFLNNKNYRVLSESEYFRSFDNVPLSAKSQEYVGGRLHYANFKEQRDLIDQDGNKVNLGYKVGVESSDYNSQSIPLSTIYTGGSIDRYLLQCDFTDVEESLRGKKIEINFRLKEDTDNNEFNGVFSFQVPNDFTNSTDPTIIDNESSLQNALSSFRNFFVNNGFSEPINTDSFVVDANAFSLTASSTSLNIILPKVTFTLSNGGKKVYSYNDFNSSFRIIDESSASSMKSIRDYEVAKIFLDKEGRKTTALTSKENTVSIGIENSDKRNILTVEIPEDEKPPEWADRYKFAVKKVGLWETFYSNRFYVDEGFRWVKLEGGDINKVSVGDDIIVKKDSNSVQDTLATVKVLDIVNQERDFIPDNTIEGSSTIDLIEEAGNYIKIRPSGFSLDYAEDEFRSIEQTSNTTSQRPFMIVRDEDGNNAFESSNGGDLPFTQATIFDIKSLLSRNDDDSSLVTKTFIANDNFDNVKDFLDVVNPYVPNNAPDPLNTPSSGTYPTGFLETQEGDDDYIAYWVVRGEIVPSTDSGGTYLTDNDGDVVTDFAESDFVGVKVRLDNSKPYVLAFEGSESGNNLNRGKLDLKLDIRVVDGYYVFETKAKPVTDNIFYETPETFDISNGNYEQRTHKLEKYFNCFVQGNGAESYQFKDKFNANFLDVDFTPTLVSQDEYKQLNRFADITWSGIFNDNSGVNGLNEFNLSKANFKDDVEKQFGGIYRLHARDTDLVLFQEDKVSFVRVGEADLFNADGTSNVSRVETVLGNQVAYTGEYGIGKDSMSFAFYGNNLYFADRRRGVICRLGNNGIFEISGFGLRSYFRNLFFEENVGEMQACYDDFYNTYVLHIPYGNTYDTWFYKEAINENGGGWISNQEFKPESMVSHIGNLFSFKDSELYKHNDRVSGVFNRFYGVDVESQVSFIFNEEFINRKNFKTIELDGSDAWDIILTTNLQKGYINKESFLLQEGIYRAFVRGEQNAIDTSTLSVQGIGEVKPYTVNTAENPTTVELFFSNVNDEVSVGDKLYDSSEQIIGNIISVNTSVNSITIDVVPSTNIGGEFVFSVKSQSVETSGLLGYYMQVDMKLEKHTKTELFLAASEVFLSTPNT